METIGGGVLDSSSVKSHNTKEIERLNNDIQDGIIKNIHDQLETDDINFTGDLSGSFEKGMDGIYHTVQTNNKYANFIENGMPAGTKVNYNALRIWVEGKLGISEGDELTQVTWNIYHKLMAHGIQPRRYMKKAIKKFTGKHGKHNAPRGSKTRLKKSSGKMSGMLKTLRKATRAMKRINRVISTITKPIKSGYKKGKRNMK